MKTGWWTYHSAPLKCSKMALVLLCVPWGESGWRHVMSGTEVTGIRIVLKTNNCFFTLTPNFCVNDRPSQRELSSVFKSEFVDLGPSFLPSFLDDLVNSTEWEISTCRMCPWRAVWGPGTLCRAPGPLSTWWSLSCWREREKVQTEVVQWPCNPGGEHYYLPHCESTMVRRCGVAWKKWIMSTNRRRKDSPGSMFCKLFSAHKADPLFFLVRSPFLWSAISVSPYLALRLVLTNIKALLSELKIYSEWSTFQPAQNLIINISHIALPTSFYEERNAWFIFL